MATRVNGLANWDVVEHALGADGLAIASYNCHACIGADGKADARRVAGVINELHCDIVGLQEVDNDVSGHPTLQLETLAAETNMQAISGFTIVNEKRSFGNALLTRLPVRAVRTHDFSFLSREARGALDVDIDFAGSVVRVIVTHLGLRPRERRFQVRQMLHILHDIPPEQVVVVLGDINEWLPLGRPLRWMHGILGQTPAERSFPARLPLFALDRVWVRPRHTLLAFGVHRSPAARMASDHLPIRALIAPFAPAAHAPIRERRAVPADGTGGL